MIVSVLGSGNGGCAVAFDCAAKGHKVRLFDFADFPANIAAIRANGGIHSRGELTDFMPIAFAGHDINHMDQTDIIYLVGPAYSTRPFAEECRPHLRKGQVVIVCPSSCGGALEFKQAAGLSVPSEDILVAETSTLPYAVRVLEPGKINVFLKLKAGILLAALPGRNTERVRRAIHDVYPSLEPAENVLQTSLQNANPVIHPSVSLLNAALIERTAGNFLFYEEGVTPAVGRLIAAVDGERIAIGKQLGIRVLPDPELGRRQGYMTEATYDRGYALAPGFKGIGAQSQLDHRYLTEDVGYGLVFMKQLADQIGLPVPAISAVIQLASVVMDRDFLADPPRTMASLGLAGRSATELRQLLA